MTVQYIAISSGGAIGVSTDGLTFTAAAASIGQPTGQKVVNDGTQWLVPDETNSVIQKIKQDGSAINGTVAFPSDMAGGHSGELEYKASNGTLILGGKDTSNYASIWYSTNGGATWTKVRLSATASGGYQIWTIRYDINANQWTCMNAATGTIYYSTNDGVSWSTSASTVGAPHAEYMQNLGIGAANNIVTQDSTANNIGYSSNGTTYVSSLVNNSGLTNIAGVPCAFSYDGTNYLIAGQGGSATNNIAVSTTPGTPTSFTLYNSPVAFDFLEGALYDGTAHYIFGFSSDLSAGVIVRSANASTFTSLSSVNTVFAGAIITNMGYYAAAAGQPIMEWLPQYN